MAQTPTRRFAVDDCPHIGASLCGCMLREPCDHCHSPLSAEEVGVVDVCATCCPHPRFTPEEWNDMRASGKADVVLALLRDIDAVDHDWAL